MYHDTLSLFDLEALPENPAGEVELFDSELVGLKGGTTAPVQSFFIDSCQMVTACHAGQHAALEL
jgi:mersacidin/lichenicidin family type 2 lantibiotic